MSVLTHLRPAKAGLRRAHAAGTITAWRCLWQPARRAPKARCAWPNVCVRGRLAALQDAPPVCSRNARLKHESGNDRVAGGSMRRSGCSDSGWRWRGCCSMTLHPGSAAVSRALCVKPPPHVSGWTYSAQSVHAAALQKGGHAKAEALPQKRRSRNAQRSHPADSPGAGGADRGGEGAGDLSTLHP